MPGVVVQTATRSGPSAPLRSPSGQFFIVGLAERGNTDAATLVRDMADVERYFGSRQAYGALYDQLKTFFAEGGLQAHAIRVQGPAASMGTLALVDRAAAPVPTLTINAASSGSWSSGCTVEVLNSGVPNTFRIIIRLGGVVVEDVANLVSPADAQTKFNTSPYIRVTNMGSATVAPNNNPAIVAETSLSAGADDRASITSTNYINALAKFPRGLGDGAVSIPGQTGATVWNALIAHAELNNRIALLASTYDETVPNLKTAAASLDSENAGLFTPWVGISDGASGIRYISPEGYVAACRTRAHEQVGPWRAPAGVLGKATTLVAVEKEYSTEDANDLDASKVSVIRKIANSIRLYGWRSVSNDVANYAYLKDRDLLNYLVVEAEVRLEDYVFESIDSKGHLLSTINAELVGMVEPIRMAGGLFGLDDADGEEIDPGFRVETGNTVNTQSSLANNEIRARLLVRVSPTGGLVSLTIVKVGILAAM